MTPRQGSTLKSGPAHVPVPNWTKLSRDDQVIVRRNGEEIASGRVEVLAHDGSILWLIQNHGRGRMLLLQRDGARIYRYAEPSRSL